MRERRCGEVDGADAVCVGVERHAERRLVGRRDLDRADDPPVLGRRHDLVAREEVRVRTEADRQLPAGAAQSAVRDAASRPRVVRVEAAHARQDHDRPVRRGRARGRCRDRAPDACRRCRCRRPRSERAASPRWRSRGARRRSSCTGVSGQPAVCGVGPVDGVDGPDAAVEELVVPERPRLAGVVPDERDVGARGRRAGRSSRGAQRGCPAKRPAGRRLPNAVTAVLDDRRGEHEVDRYEQDRQERKSPRHEDERSGGEPDAECDEAQRPEMDAAVLQPPPAASRPNVSETADELMNLANGTATGKHAGDAARRRTAHGAGAARRRHARPARASRSARTARCRSRCAPRSGTTASMRTPPPRRRAAR